MKPALLVVLLAVLAQASLAEDVAPSGQPAQPRPVVSEILATEATRLRDFPGTILPQVETALGFLAAGRIETRPVAIGDKVKAGEVIATLDRIALNADVDGAEARLRAAAAEADLARETHARTRELVDRNVATEAQLEQATANRDATAAAVTAAEADLALARDAASNGTLVAPADGVVVAANAEPGSVVAAGSPVVTLATDSGLEAVIDVPAQLAAYLEPGAGFLIRRREGQGEAFAGTLRLIEPVANAASRTRRLRITLAAGSGLRLGTLVRVAVDKPADAPLLTLPRAAIMADNTVWRIAAGRKLEKVTVILGEELGNRVVVSVGLNTGDEVLVRGIHSVSERQIVGERIGS